MKATTPVVPGYSTEEVQFRDQAGNVVLPAVLTEDGQNCLSRWELSDEDRKRIADGQDVYVWTKVSPVGIMAFTLEVSTAAEVIGDRMTQAVDEWPTELILE